MSPELGREVGAPGFSITRGPFLRVLRRLHLTRGDGTPRAWAFVVLAWVPLCIGAVFHVIVGRQPAPILFDISVHARLLIGIPLLIQAGRLLEQRCRTAVAQLYDGNFADRADVDRIINSAKRLRGSRLAELLIVVVALLLGQAVLWGRVGPTGLFAGVSQAGAISFAQVWYASVALPIVQFCFFAWVWQWLIWTYVIVRVSRLQLATIATHPDRAAGIGFLAAPVSAFWGFVLAIATMLASVWGTEILDHRATLETFVPTFLVFLASATVFACGSLCFYAGILYRARHRDIPKYNRLALEYVRQFDAKWAAGRPRDEPLLGMSDIQSLNDMLGTYGHLEAMRLVPFGPRALVGLVAAAVIPMLPLAATTMPIGELLKKVGGALLGGLPV
ncbi:MAG: hypothetical protein JWO36_4386 [Myxococcales bacterium]|nr:hypothetical protein [Myxococcales bacterium]